MSLKNKILIWSLSVTLTVLSGVLLIFTYQQECRMVEDAKKQTEDRLELLSENMQTIPKRYYSETQGVTRRSLIQYYFASFVRILQSNRIQYSLSWDGEYVYHIGPWDVMKQENGALVDKIYYRAETLMEAENVKIYIASDLTEVYERIGEMWRSAWIFLGIAVVVLTLALTLLVSKALRPITVLTEQTEKIASGQYSLRTQIAGKDEVGQLAQAFNRMAEAVEDKVESLTDELQRRKLLLGALTHELKTPMTAVIGYADSLLRMPLSEADKIACAQKIYEAAKRTEKLSQELMRLISLEESGAVEKKSFPIASLAMNLKELWPDAEIRWEEGTVYGDPVLLESLVSNLIDNGVKASEGRSVQVVLKKNAFTVIDHGKGIAPEHLKHLTEPFYRVDPSRSRKSGGAGIGLAICQLIARLHGGEIMIESQEGMGTTVQVRFAEE